MELARKLARYACTPEAQFPEHNAGLVVREALERAWETPKGALPPQNLVDALTEGELAFLVLVAMDSLFESGAPR